MVGLARPACATRAPGTHSQVVLPCMLTTHLASWLVSRVLKGRTLTATFTEAPAMAPDTPTLLSWRTETENGVRATRGEPDITSSFSRNQSLHPPSPATQPLKDPVSIPLAFLPNVTVLRDSRRWFLPLSPATSQLAGTWAVTPALPGVLAPDQGGCISSGCHRPS